MAKRASKRLEQINIHLLKDDIRDFGDALADGKSPRHSRANTEVLPGGMLYYEDPPAKRASWRDFLAPGFANLPAFNAQHASALLFFTVGSRRRKQSFAVTFGYGRALLADSALVADFGLRTALNLCKSDTLRAVNFRTIEERTRIARIQLSDAGSVDAFRMNMDTDLLRGLEAESKDQNVCERLGARWSNMVVAARVEIADLPRLASNLLQYYRRRGLPAEYAWIDNVRRVTDPSELQSLDAELETRVNGGDFDGIRLAFPEIAGSTVGVDIKLFNAEAGAEDFTSGFADYLAKRPQQVDWGVSTAKTSHKVYLIDSGSGVEREHLSLYRCIVAEFDHEGDRYLLVDGEWFRLDRGFVNEVNREVNAIPRLQHRLPAWNTGESEGDWNRRACRSWRDAALLDRSNIPHGGGRSKIEPADFLTRGRLFGHVKRRDMSSSGLSHLFAQGVVSGQVISQDADFRQKLTRCLPASHRQLVPTGSTAFDSRDWTIGFVILGGDAQRPAAGLPFFSKVNLRGAIQQLKLMNYKVGLIGV